MNLTLKGLLASGLLVCVTAAAQELDELQPAVDTSAEPAAEQVAERDALEPRVSSETLTAGVRRREMDNGVMDEMDLGRTEITGNQELPKVLYIVPWQKSDPGELVGPPVNTLLDEVLAPVDRTEFLRQVDYYNDLNAEGSDTEE